MFFLPANGNDLNHEKRFTFNPKYCFNGREKKTRKKLFCMHYGFIKLVSILCKLEKFLENWGGGNFSYDVNST